MLPYREQSAITLRGMTDKTAISMNIKEYHHASHQQMHRGGDEESAS